MTETDEYQNLSPINGRVLGILFMQTYCITSVLYLGMSRVATNSGVGAIELCFIRTSINFLISIGTVGYSGKHVIKDVPAEKRNYLLARSIAGLIGFTCMIMS